MAPSPIESASIELDYPLYALDFDREDATRLVVGGGGGPGGSGVGNKITVLDSPNAQELRNAGEIKLSRDEDSVMSLAIGAQKGKTTYVYAGVNSSAASIAKGKNEHLRTLALETSRSGGPRLSSSSSSSSTSSAKAASVAKMAEVSRAAMFTDPGESAYQRLLRVAGPVGAAATAMGKEAQLAVFDTAAAGGALPKVRGVLDLPREAEDLDIVQTGDGEYQVAFCYKYELHVVDVGGVGKAGAGVNSEPRLVYTMPEENSERPAFRSIRYLSPSFVLAVSNLPKRSGVIIQALRLPTPGHETARLAATARVPRAISATAMAVTNLSPPSASTAPTVASASNPTPLPAASRTAADTQFLIAIAGNDSSISLYTLDQITSGTLSLLVNLDPVYTIKEAHGPDNITGLSGLAFSTFSPPKTHLRPQAVKLASISLQNTAAVHSIPLRRHVDKTPRNKKGPPRPVRYVVGLKSLGPTSRPLVIVLSLIVLFIALTGQTILELYGASPAVLGAHRFFPSWHGTLRSPEHQPPFFAEQKNKQQDDFLSKIAASVTPDPASGEKLVLFEADHPPGGNNENDDTPPADKKIQVDVHQDEVHGDAKEWHELPEDQKAEWEKKLGDAGVWTRDMGESVFRGILFGQLADAVGNIVAG